MSTIELLLRLLKQMSIEHIDADKLLEQLRKRIAPYDADSQEIGVLVVPEVLGIKEWSRRQDVKNKLRKPPSTLRDEEEEDDDEE